MKTLAALPVAVGLLALPASADAKPKPRNAEKSVIVQPLPGNFDLARMRAEDAIDSKTALPADLRPPRGVDPSTRAWTPPSYELTLGEGGPVLSLGAMGTRRKGMPKLAHVGLDWDF